MTTSIFVDLDGCLVRSYTKNEVDTNSVDEEFLNGVVVLFNGVISKKRPHVDQFLEAAHEHGDVFLFTSAQPGYAKSVLKAFHLVRHFKKIYSGVYHGPRTIANELKLYGRSWILVDDSTAEHDTVKHKLSSLGLTTDLVTPSTLERHFHHLSSYQPHLEANDEALVQATEELRAQVRRIEKTMILY